MSEELKERRFEAGEKVRWNHEDQWKSGVFAGYANSSGGECCLVECGNETHVVGPSLVMPLDREPLTVCFEIDPNDEAELRQWGMACVQMWRASIDSVYSDRTSVVTLFPQEGSEEGMRRRIEILTTQRDQARNKFLADLNDENREIKLMDRDRDRDGERTLKACARCGMDWPEENLRGGWCVDCLHRLARDILDTGRCRECGKFGGVHTKDCPVGAAFAEPGGGGDA